MNRVQIDKPNFSNTVQAYHQNRPIQKVHFRRKSEVQYSRNKAVPHNKGLCNLINCCKKPTNHDSLYSLSSLDATIYHELSAARRAKSVNTSHMKHMKEKCNSEAPIQEENKTYKVHKMHTFSNTINHPHNKSIHKKKDEYMKPPVLEGSIILATNAEVPGTNSAIQNYYSNKKTNNNTYKIEGGRKAIYTYNEIPTALTKHCAIKKQMRSLTNEGKNTKQYPNYKNENVKYSFSHNVVPNVVYNNTYCDHRDLSKNQTHYDKNYFGALENYKYVGYALKSDRQSRSKYKPREIDIYNNLIEDKDGKSAPLIGKENNEALNGEEETRESKEINLMKNDPSVMQNKRVKTNLHNIDNLQNTISGIKDTSSLTKMDKTEKSNSRSSTNTSSTAEKQTYYTANEECIHNQNGSIAEPKNIKHMKMNIDFFNMDDNMNISITKANTIHENTCILNKEITKNPIEQVVKPLYVDNECQTIENCAPKKIMKRKRRIRIIRRIKRKRPMKRKPRKTVSSQKKRRTHGGERGRMTKPKKRPISMKIKSKKKTKTRTKFVMKRKPRSKNALSDKKKKTQLSKNGFKLDSRKYNNVKIISKVSSTKKEHEEKKYSENKIGKNDLIPIQMNYNRSNDQLHKEIKQNGSNHIDESSVKIINLKTTNNSRDSKKLSFLNTVLPDENLNTESYEFRQVGDIKTGTFDASIYAEENAHKEQYHKDRTHEKLKSSYAVNCSETQFISGCIEASKTAPNVYVRIQIDNMYKGSDKRDLDSMKDQKRNLPNSKEIEDTTAVNNRKKEQKSDIISMHKENKENTENRKSVTVPPIDIIGYRLKTNNFSRNSPRKEYSTSIKRNTSNAALDGAQYDQTPNHLNHQIKAASVINSTSGISKEEQLRRAQTENNKHKIKNPRKLSSDDNVVEQSEVSPLIQKLINTLNKIAKEKSEKKESNTTMDQVPCNHNASNISPSVIRKSEESKPSMEICRNDEDLNCTSNKENTFAVTHNPSNACEAGITNQGKDAEHLQQLHQFKRNVQEGNPTSNEQKISFLLYFILFYSKKLKNIINLGLKNTSIDDDTFNMKFFILCLVNLVENCKSSVLLINTEFCNLISDLLDKITKYIIRVLENKVGKYELMLTKVYLIELLKHVKLLKLCVDSEEGGNNIIDNKQIEELMKIDNLLLQRRENSSKCENLNTKQHPCFLADIEEEFLRDWNHSNNAFTEFENPINKSVSERNIKAPKNSQIPSSVIKYKTIHHPVVVRGNNRNATSMVNFNVSNEGVRNENYAYIRNGQGPYKKDSSGNTTAEHNNEEFNNIQDKINQLKEEIKHTKTDSSYNMEQHSFFISHLDYLQDMCRGNDTLHLTNEDKRIRFEYVTSVLERIREIVQRQNKQINSNNESIYNINKTEGKLEEKKINPIYNGAFYEDSKNAGSNELLNRDSSWFTTETIPLDNKTNAKRIIRTYKQYAHFDETEELKELNKSLNSIILSKDELLYEKSKDYYSIIQMYNQELSLLSEMTNDHYISDHETDNGTDDEHLNHMNAEQFYNFVQWIQRHKEDENQVDKSNGIRNFEMSNINSDMLKNMYSTFLIQEKGNSGIKNINFINKLTTMEKDDLERSNPFHNMEDAYNDHTCNSSAFQNEDNALIEYQTFKEGEENEKVQYFKIGS